MSKFTTSGTWHHNHEEPFFKDPFLKQSWWRYEGVFLCNLGFNLMKQHNNTFVKLGHCHDEECHGRGGAAKPILVLKTWTWSSWARSNDLILSDIEAALRWSNLSDANMWTGYNYSSRTSYWVKLNLCHPHVNQLDIHCTPDNRCVVSLLNDSGSFS